MTVWVVRWWLSGSLPSIIGISRAKRDVCFARHSGRGCHPDHNVCCRTFSVAPAGLLDPHEQYDRRPLLCAALRIRREQTFGRYQSSVMAMQLWRRAMLANCVSLTGADIETAKVQALFLV